MAAGKAISIKTRTELNQQAENLEAEIKQLEDKISNEKKEAAKIEEIIENSGKDQKKFHVLFFKLSFSFWRNQKRW